MAIQESVEEVVEESMEEAVEESVKRLSKSLQRKRYGTNRIVRQVNISLRSYQNRHFVDMCTF